MKVRTGIIIAAAVIVGVGGIGYAAYYTMRGQETPVEVAPVSNVSLDDSWITYDDSMSGSVTSKVSQTVSLDSEHEVDEVYVREGEEVKTGDPLFSYDMTLEEIELEAQEIELQSLQLQLTKYQKDLTKYQNTPATATLEEVEYDDLSESAEEVPAEEAYAEPAEPEPVEDPQAVEEPVPEEPAEPVEESVQDSAAADTGADTGVSEGADSVSNADADAEDSDYEENQTEQSETSDEDAVYRNAVLQFESLMMSIELFLDENGNLQYDSSVVAALYNARDFFENNLATNIQQNVYEENQETYVQTSYELKQEVVHALSDAELSELKDYVSRMFSYIAGYEAQPAAMSYEPEAAAETMPEETETETEEKDTESELETDESETEGVQLFSNVTVIFESDTGSSLGYSDLGSNEAGDEVELDAEAEYPAAEGYEFDHWEVNSENIDDIDLSSPEISFIMPEDDVTLTAVYTLTADIDERITIFIGEYEGIYVPNWKIPTVADLEQAIYFYIDAISDGSALENPDDEEIIISLLESYANVSDLVKEYLDREGEEGIFEALGVENYEEAVSRLESMYKKMCIEYCILLLEDEYNEIYDLINPDGSFNEELLAEFLDNLEAVYDAYLQYLDSEELGDAINAILEELLLKYAEEFDLITEPSSEESSEEPSNRYDEDEYEDWYGDYDWEEGEEGEYTAEELAEMIAELEQQIKETELSIRECELNLEQAQRVVDEKVVTSELDGTVVSIGDPGEDSDDEYFVKVTDMVGLYAKGVISELALDTVNLGDVVSGITEDGQSFTAVIKDIADYPDANGLDYTYGSGNTNATYYSFSALIDDPEGIEEGSAELTLSTALADDRDSIWLDTYMVRTDAAGNNYVYVEGDNGELEMRYVSTGAVDSDWAIEVTGGLSRADNIAFPYGDDVHEGAPTKEVSNLDSMYE